MKLIAHRGLIEGPNTDLENRPDQINLILSQGIDCEIDLWMVDSKLYLGHDKADYLIDESFLNQPGLWIHAKNLAALYWLTDKPLCYFWHERDKFTLTSTKIIWTYPGQDLTKNSVLVLPEWDNPEFQNLPVDCHGICSDYITKLKEKIYDYSS